MIQEPSQPPRIAARLMNLFNCDDNADAIRGDLLEESLDLKVKEGTASACRWYWRQAMKTIAHLAVAGFRTAPWLIAGAILGAIVIGWFSNWLIQKAVAAVLHRYEVYAYVDAYVFWRIYNGIEHLLIPMLMGCMVAVTAKRRELVAAITLSLLTATERGVALVQEATWISRHLPHTYAPLLEPAIIAILVSPMFILIGVFRSRFLPITRNLFRWFTGRRCQFRTEFFRRFLHGHVSGVRIPLLSVQRPDVVVVVGLFGIDKFELVASLEENDLLLSAGRTFSKVRVPFGDCVLYLSNTEGGVEEQQMEDEKSLHGLSYRDLKGGGEGTYNGRVMGRSSTDHIAFSLTWRTTALVVRPH